MSDDEKTDAGGSPTKSAAGDVSMEPEATGDQADTAAAGSAAGAAGGGDSDEQQEEDENSDQYPLTVVMFFVCRCPLWLKGRGGRL